MPGWKTGETIFGHSLNSRLYLRLLSGSELGFGIDWLRRNYKAWSKLAVKRHQGERLTAGHRVGWTAGRARSFQSKIATMKTITRRDLFVAIPAFAATGAGAARACGAQAHASEFPMPQSGQPMSRTVAADDRPGPVAGLTRELLVWRGQSRSTRWRCGGWPMAGGAGTSRMESWRAGGGGGGGGQRS